MKKISFKSKLAFGVLIGIFALVLAINLLQDILGSKILGFDILNQTNSSSAGEVYSMNAYGVFYILLIVIIIAVAIVTISIMMPRIKQLT